MATEKTKRFRYSSPLNISFSGELDTRIHLDDWASMRNAERDSALLEALLERVVWVEEIEADHP
jgi:hypothetical protein